MTENVSKPTRQKLITIFASKRKDPFLSFHREETAKCKDENIYKELHLVECFLGKAKILDMRFNKSAQILIGFLNFVDLYIWLLFTFKASILCGQSGQVNYSISKT